MSNRITVLYDDLESVIFSDVSGYQLEKITGLKESTFSRYRSGKMELENMQYLNALELLKLKGIQPVNNLMRIKSDVVKSLESDQSSGMSIARNSDVSHTTVNNIRNGKQKNPKLKILSNLYGYYYIKEN